jgi:capsular exopolysaccharide synthesis family protein
VANLGKYFSEKLDHKTLVIDANLRNPSMHKHFKLAQDIGLSDVIENSVSFDVAVKEINPRLKVITAGKTSLNPITLLDATKLDALLKHIQGKFEVILIDSPDLRSFKDAAILANHVDAATIVVNEGKTRRIIVQTAVEPLKAKRAKLIGVILNNRQYVIPQFIYDRV